MTTIIKGLVGRTHAGYTVTDDIGLLNDDGRIVLAKKPIADGTEYVTWRTDTGKTFFWGHYFTNHAEARADLFKRAE